MNYTLISSPAIAACNKRPLLQDVSLASHALELTKEEACLARVIDSNFQCYSDYEYYKEIKSIYAKCVARYRSVGPTTKFTRLDIKSDHMYTPEVIFEACQFLVHSNFFAEHDAGKRSMYYTLTADKIPKVPVADEAATSPSIETGNIAKRRREIGFPNREIGRKRFPQNQYFDHAMIRDLQDGESYDILADDDRHYQAKYHREDGGYLELLKWGSTGIISGDLTKYCLATFGSYSDSDGLNKKKNRYTGKRQNKVDLASRKSVKVPKQPLKIVSDEPSTHVNVMTKESMDTLKRHELNIQKNKSDIFALQSNIDFRFEEILKDVAEVLIAQKMLERDCKEFLQLSSGRDDNMDESGEISKLKECSCYTIIEKLLEAEMQSTELQRFCTKYKREKMSKLS